MLKIVVMAKRSFIVAACLLAASLSMPAGAAGGSRDNLDVPAGELISALKSLAMQSKIELVYQPEQLRDIHTEGVKGAYSPQEAIAILLKGTALRVYTASSGAMIIAPISTSSTQGGDLQNTAQGASEMRLVQANGSTATAGQTADEQRGAAGNSDAKHADEIIVTAQKRSERLQDVPVPVTAITAETLLNNNQLRLQDYYTKVPGLSLALIGNGGAPTLTIRGLATGGATNPTVGIVIDDVSYGASEYFGLGNWAPDLDPSDLARVEVLRGPQGTLYGASSLGGLLKFVTVDPSTGSFSGRMQAGVSSVSHGDDLGYSVRGSVNVPLGETFAVRLSGQTRQDPGYIDNVQNGRSDANKADVSGGRIAALWRPSDAFSMKLSALYQDSKRHGSNEVHQLPGLEGLQQRVLPGAGGYDRNTQAYGATLNARLGAADLTAATGYSIDKIVSYLDLAPIANGLYSTLANTYFGVQGAFEPLHTKTTKFSQEVRLSVPIGSRLEWLVGAFYTQEDYPTDAVFFAADPATGATAGTLLGLDIPSDYEEYAAFTDLTVHFTDRFDIQFGGRLSENRQTYSSTRGGPLVAVFFRNQFVVPEVRSKDSPFTYLVTPRLRVSPDLMVYARFASGYRPGGPNTACGPTIPCGYGADTTQNYELGIKGALFDRALSYEASAYYIDWKDIQVNLLSATAGIGFTDNGGQAKSRGVEISVETRPLKGLTLSAWVAYNDAELTKVPLTSTLGGIAGDRLPYSSPFSGNFSASQEFPLWSNSAGFVSGSVSYVDNRRGNFSQTALAVFPAYTQVDLSAGVRFNSWTVSAFLNNAADERGVLRNGAASTNPAFVSYIEPRTVGLTVAKTF